MGIESGSHLEAGGRRVQNLLLRTERPIKDEFMLVLVTVQVEGVEATGLLVPRSRLLLGEIFYYCFDVMEIAAIITSVLL